MAPGKLLFVGEAPSHEEVEAGGIPLVGPSGRVFGQMLRMAGIARTGSPPADFYPNERRRGIRPMLWERADHGVTNVFVDKLDNNDVSSICMSAPKAQEQDLAQPEWYIRGAGYLLPEYRMSLDALAASVRAFDPAVIVPLGGTALWAFTGSTAIAESRGTVMRATRVAPGVKLVPTLHPAYVIQDWRMLGTVVRDIERAVVEATDPDRIIHHGARELWVEPTLTDLDMWWREHGAKSRRLAVDIETPRGQISCVGVAADAVTAICVPFVDWRKPNRSYWPSADTELEAWQWLAKVLGSDTPKVLQNGSFDVFWLLMEMGLKVRNYCHDTRLMHHALYPELPKSLAFIGSSYCLVPGPWKLLRTGQEKRDS